MVLSTGLFPLHLFAICLPAVWRLCFTTLLVAIVVSPSSVWCQALWLISCFIQMCMVIAICKYTESCFTAVLQTPLHKHATSPPLWEEWCCESDELGCFTIFVSFLCLSAVLISLLQLVVWPFTLLWVCVPLSMMVQKMYWAWACLCLPGVSPIKLYYTIIT